jgi:hypothetical protein
MAASEVFEAASEEFMAASEVFETASEVFKPLSNEYIYNPSLRSQSAPLRAEIPDQVRDDEYKHTYMQQSIPITQTTLV